VSSRLNLRIAAANCKFCGEVIDARYRIFHYLAAHPDEVHLVFETEKK